MKHLVAVLSEPVEGKDAEYHDYYENLHLDEVLVTTGWQTAQRFVLSDEAGANDLALGQVSGFSVERDARAEEDEQQRQHQDPPIAAAFEKLMPNEGACDVPHHADSRRCS